MSSLHRSWNAISAVSSAGDIGRSVQLMVTLRSYEVTVGGDPTSTGARRPSGLPRPARIGITVAVARLRSAPRPLMSLGWLRPVPLEGIAGVKRDGVLSAHADQSDRWPGETSSSGMRDYAGCER